MDQNLLAKNIYAYSGAKIIRTLVFSPAKIRFKSVISIFFLQCVSRKYEFTCPNIHLAMNRNSPVRFLSDNSQCSTQRSPYHPVCLESH